MSTQTGDLFLFLDIASITEEGNRYQRHQIFPLLLRTNLTELFQYILLHHISVTDL